ncbi:MAG: arsenate reductase ArsC [Nitrospira sp.]|nr:arsenate reductase ArsC [Nitrospira sp.]
MTEYNIKQVKKILFVCIENSCRSQIAEAFARIHGDGRIDAYSAGSKPSGMVNKKAIDVMREIGYDLSIHQSKSIGEIPDVVYDIVITMGCGDECPVVKALRRIEWNIPDPKDMTTEELRTIRDLIESKVKTLI